MPTRPPPDRSEECRLSAAIRGALRVAVGRRREAAGFAAMAARLWTLAHARPPEGTRLSACVGRWRGGPNGLYVVVGACCSEAYFDAGTLPDADAVRAMVAAAGSNALEAAADNHARGEGCAGLVAPPGD